jgi:hypothetical protein
VASEAARAVCPGGAIWEVSEGRPAGGHLRENGASVSLRQGFRGLHPRQQVWWGVCPLVWFGEDDPLIEREVGPGASQFASGPNTAIASPHADQQSTLGQGPAGARPPMPF